MADYKYITDRWMVEIVRNACREHGFNFASLSDNWILELSYGELVKRVIGYRFSLNDSVASQISQDKVATYQVLSQNTLQAVPHVLMRTKVSRADRDVIAKWQRIVIKPLNGSGGHDVMLFDSAKEAIYHIEKSSLAGWAAAPYLDIVREIRVIMLDCVPLIAYEKTHVHINGLKMFNLGLGAIAHDIEIDETLLVLAQNAQKALRLRLCTVDIIETTDGERQILEINDSIMMEYYMRQSAENKQRATDVYDAIVDAMMKPRG